MEPKELRECMEPKKPKESKELEEFMEPKELEEFMESKEFMEPNSVSVRMQGRTHVSADIHGGGARLRRIHPIPRC